MSLDYLGMDSLADQLGAPREGEAVVDLPLAQVRPDPNQPRRRRNAKADAELADSIRADKVRQPIVVLPADDEGIYTIVFGERRWDCSGKAGKETIPAIVREMTPDEIIIAQLSENIDRDDMALADEVGGVMRALELLSSTKAVAQAMGKPQGWVSKRVKIGKSPIYLVEFLEAGYSSDAEGLYQLAQLGQKDSKAAEDLVNLWHEDESRRVGLREQVAALRDAQTAAVNATKKPKSAKQKAESKADSAPAADASLHVMDATYQDGRAILITDKGEIAVDFAAGVVEALYNAGLR